MQALAVAAWPIDAVDATAAYLKGLDLYTVQFEPSSFAAFGNADKPGWLETVPRIGSALAGSVDASFSYTRSMWLQRWKHHVEFRDGRRALIEPVSLTFEPRQPRSCCIARFRWRHGGSS